MDSISKWAPTVLVLVSLVAFLLRPLLFVRKEAKDEAKEKTDEKLNAVTDRARVDVAMNELRSTLIGAVSDIKGEIRADQKLVMHRLSELEGQIKELRAVDADRTSKVVAVDSFAHRLSELERLSDENLQRLVRVETLIETKR